MARTSSPPASTSSSTTPTWPPGWAATEETMSAATSAGTSSWRDFAARSGSDLRLVQFGSDVVYGDAATMDTVGWRETFVRAGIPTATYARRIDAHHAAFCEPLEAYQHRAGDVILFHYTT